MSQLNWGKGNYVFQREANVAEMRIDNRFEEHPAHMDEVGGPAAVAAGAFALGRSLAAATLPPLGSHVGRCVAAVFALLRFFAKKFTSFGAGVHE